MQASEGGHTDVSSCATACPSNGCCGRVPGCHGSACSGGGCCAASRNICLIGCHSYLGTYPPSPPPPLPPLPPSPPPLPLAPCYTRGVYVYSDGNPYGKDQWHLPVDSGSGSVLASDAGIGTDRFAIIEGITRAACLAKLRDNWAS